MLWRQWLKKRHRDRVRALSRVRFRLTREGVHYVGVLLFIFIGAILRDINLLILLAGAMIGLLLLQWRFNTRTLLRLTADRQLARTTTVGRANEISLRLTNPKSWLGCWLVLVEDPVHKLLPDPQKLAEKGIGILDEVRPQGISETRYSLTFHQRGRFRIGPSTISTRFPLGLGRGSRTLDNAGELTVFPALGKLSPRIKVLFQQEMHGSAKSSPKVGLHEAEFYGLRPWATGDSRRWIHWRTTARLGELSVRQFERQQRRQICVLLDLYGNRNRRKGEVDEPCETAISFLATLATETAMHGGDRLAVAVAASESFALPSVQSAVLVENLLERLSVVMSSSSPQLDLAIHSISIPLLNNPHLLVVSTRDDQTPALLKDFSGAGRRLASRLQVTWLNVARGDLEPYFSWT
jgi:uncharacterized protein (DUF58 family)